MRFLLFLLSFLVASTAFTHEINIKDLYGRTVETPENVSKIVAIGPGALRFIVYAGVQDMVVGREIFEEKLSNSLRPYTYALPESYKKLPIVSVGGPGKMPNLEAILDVEPDVIFAVAFSREQLETIQQKTNIPVVGLNYGAAGHVNFDDVNDSLRLVGYITHSQKRAQELMNKIAMLRKDIMKRVEGTEQKSVYMASVAFKGARSFTSSEKNHPACMMLGLTNIADKTGGGGGHVVMQAEALLMRQPDYIFFDVTGLSTVKERYASDVKIYSLLRAVSEGRAYTVLPYNWYNSNIENIFLTAYFMGKIIYPEKFSDVEVAHYADEIYNTFLHTAPYQQIAAKHPAFRSLKFEKSGFRFE